MYIEKKNSKIKVRFFLRRQSYVFQCLLFYSRRSKLEVVIKYSKFILCFEIFVKHIYNKKVISKDFYNTQKHIFKHLF